jgi:hypothetical protein
MEVEKTAQTDQTEKEKKSWEDRCKQNRLINRSRLAGFAKQIEKEEKTAKKKVYDLATKRPFLDSMRGGGSWIAPNQTRVNDIKLDHNLSPSVGEGRRWKVSFYHTILVWNSVH